MTNLPKNLKRKRKELALKERRLRQAGAILDKGVENMRAIDSAREAALESAERRGYVRGCKDVSQVVTEAKTIAGARKAVAAFMADVHQAEAP